MKVTYHIYKDYQASATGGSDEEVAVELARKKAALRRRYSVVSMRWHPARRRLFLGMTHMGGDLLVEFNPATGRFRSCGYHRTKFCHPTENKIHKGIWLDEKEDALYFGTTTLRPISETIVSRGGALARYRVAERRFDLIDRPTPTDFYQAINYDPVRRKAYMHTMPGSCFAVYDLRKRRLVRSDFMESTPHLGAIDDEGGVWGTCGFGRQSFFRYLPDEDRYEFPEGCAFPEARKAANVMYSGAGPIDSFINARDGFLYAGSALGEVIRLDPLTKEIKYLGKPFAGIRLPGMHLASDGMIYMCGGTDGVPMLARYDREKERFEYLGRVQAGDGLCCQRCHELVVVDGVAYVGETDNAQRSGYLWACEL